MTQTSVGFAIVGCGKIARRHARCISESKRSHLVSVYDRDPQRTAAFAARVTSAEQQGVRPAASYEELLKRDDIDALLVAAPATVHAELALAAVESKKHVLVEKPIDVDVDAARTLVRAAEHHRVKLSVVSQNRFHDDHLWLDDQLRKGRLGRPVITSVFSLWNRDQAYYEEAPGRGLDDPREGGVLLNQGVHFVDLMLWLFGKATAVTCQRGLVTHQIAAEDTAVLTIEFASGAFGTFQSSTSVYPQEPARIEVRCELGSVVVRGGKAVDYEWREDLDLPLPPSAQAAGYETDRLAPFRRQHHDFAGAILDDRAPLVSGEQAVRVVELIQAAYESADRGQRVSLL